jgi:hypothetical protein
MTKIVQTLAEELRKWWSFDDRQHHTHSWHDRETFIELKLPELLRDVELKTSDNGKDAT